SGIWASVMSWSCGARTGNRSSAHSTRLDTRRTASGRSFRGSGRYDSFESRGWELGGDVIRTGLPKTPGAAGQAVGQTIDIADLAPRGFGPFAEIHGLVGWSLPVLQLGSRIEALARSPATVLIQGETGTGKELIARALHRMSPRSSAAFFPHNFSAIPDSLVDSELFGHARGSSRALRAGARGHALPGRDRRRESVRADQAPPRAPGRRGSPCWGRSRASRGCAHRCGNAPGPCRRRARGPVSSRPL